MFNPSEVQSVPGPLLLAVLADLVGAGGQFDACILKLFQNDVIPTRDSVLADLDEADFTGYADVNAVAFGTPYYDADGAGIVTAPSHEFVATGSTIANVIYGFYLTDDPATVLRAAYRFADPVGIGAAGQGVTVVPFLKYSGT